MLFASNSGVFVDIFRQSCETNRQINASPIYTIYLNAYLKSSKVLGKGTSQMRNGGRTQYEMCMDERGNKSDDSIASQRKFRGRNFRVTDF